MALTEITTIATGLKNKGAGATATAADLANGNKIAYSRNLVLFVQETGGVNPVTPTISSNTDDKGFTKTIAEAIAADGERFYGPFDENFNKGGYIEITYTGTGTPDIYPFLLKPV